MSKWCVKQFNGGQVVFTGTRKECFDWIISQCQDPIFSSFRNENDVEVYDVGVLYALEKINN